MNATGAQEVASREAWAWDRQFRALQMQAPLHVREIRAAIQRDHHTLVRPMDD